MAPPAVLAQPRPVCGRCRRPTSVCYCVALPRIDTSTRVVILQHPRERDVPIGTARMASLCLPGAELHVGVRWDTSAPLARALGDPARPPILLYPAPGARDILRDPPRGPVTLVVVDGTWSQARTVVRDNPVLQTLPRYAFATPEPSQYRIRREPRAEYVSTIEALMHVLGVLEGDPARFRSLLDPFRMMVDAQLACQARAPRRRVRQPRSSPPRCRVPDLLIRRFDDLVCVVGEANAWPHHTRTTNPPDELVHWVAHRVSTGESFDMIAAPEQPLSPSTPFHTELAEAALRRGAPRTALFAAYAQFSRPTDLIAAWGTFGLGLLLDGGGALPAERIDLRAVAHHVANRKLGSLEAYAATIASASASASASPSPSPSASASPSPSPSASASASASASPLAPRAPGRAGRRLAMLVQIVHAWRDLASTS